MRSNIDNLYDKHGPTGVGSVIDSWNVCNQFDNIKCNIDNLLLKYY